jgi:ubiquinone/menaquinone biosynthesis C-methylase UbiE
MTRADDDHHRVIIDQFARQAESFSQMRNHSPDLILQAAETSPDDMVLDVACGPGLMACEFGAIARHVTGIDLTPAMIEHARALQELRGQSNISWHVGDVAALPFPANSFSLVFTRYSFHHFLNPRAVLAEMVRTCAPDGRVVVVDTFTSSPEQAEQFNRMEKLRDPSHVRALSLDELSDSFHVAGLKEIKSQFYKHEFGLEAVLQSSFPNLDNADRVRQLFIEDVGKNRLGLGIQQKDGAIHFAYPIIILVGRKK